MIPKVRPCPKCGRFDEQHRCGGCGNYDCECDGHFKEDAVEDKPRSRNDSIPIEQEFGGETDVHFTPAPARKPADLLEQQRARDRALGEEIAKTYNAPVVRQFLGSPAECSVRVVPGRSFPGPYFICDLPAGHEGEHHGEIIDPDKLDAGERVFALKHAWLGDDIRELRAMMLKHNPSTCSVCIEIERQEQKRERRKKDLAEHNASSTEGIAFAELFQEMLWRAYCAGKNNENFEAWYQREILR